MLFSKIAIVASVAVGSMSMMSNVVVDAQVRSPTGFIFDCDGVSCLPGTYQDVCPQCDDLQYGEGVNVLQCSCFDSDKSLQAVSTVQDAQNCASVTASHTGSLVCNQPVSTKKHKPKRDLDSVTAGPTPEFLQTASPTVGSGPVLVDFVFNCFEGSCPTGPYQQFCPRCSVNTDSTTPGNSPQDSLSCLCFNDNGQMLLRTSTMWGFEACPSISTSIGGTLQCLGAGRKSGITTYGG